MAQVKDSRGNLAVAGLVLIPAGIVLVVGGVVAAGAVLLGAGWLLTIVALVLAANAARQGPPLFASRPLGPPTFILATAVAAIGVGSQEPLAGVAVGYLAVLWSCVRFWRYLT